MHSSCNHSSSITEKRKKKNIWGKRKTKRRKEKEGKKNNDKKTKIRKSKKSEREKHTNKQTNKQRGKKRINGSKKKEAARRGEKRREEGISPMSVFFAFFRIAPIQHYAWLCALIVSHSSSLPFYFTSSTFSPPHSNDFFSSFPDRISCTSEYFPLYAQMTLVLCLLLSFYSCHPAKVASHSAAEADLKGDGKKKRRRAVW